MPDWSPKLCNLYWQLRYRRSRDLAARRRFYRYIEKEKRRLESDVGVDPEELRLLCRWLANPGNRHAERAWRAYVGQLRLPF